MWSNFPCLPTTHLLFHRIPGQEANLSDCQGRIPLVTQNGNWVNFISLIFSLKWRFLKFWDPEFGPSFQGGKTARPNKPAQQMQHARGFIVGCANGWLWSPGRQSTPNRKLGELYMQHVTYGLQGDWLHVCKAVLLVQTSQAFVQI